MWYEKLLPYDARVDEREALFAKIRVDEWDDYQRLREGPPQTIASRHRAHDAKYDDIKRELLTRVDRDLPLLPPVFEAEVLPTFLCPVVAVFKPKEVSLPSLPYEERERRCDLLKQTMTAAQSRRLITHWFVDTGPCVTKHWVGRLFAGFENQNQCDRTTTIVMSQHHELLDEVEFGHTEKLVVAGSAEATGVHRSHEIYGNVTLRVESNPKGAKLSLNFLEDPHGLPEEFARGIFEGVRYAASLGLGLGSPIVGAKVRVISGKVHEVDSRISAYVHAAAHAFHDALVQLECRPLFGAS